MRSSLRNVSLEDSSLRTPVSVLRSRFGLPLEMTLSRIASRMSKSLCCLCALITLASWQGSLKAEDAESETGTIEGRVIYHADAKRRWRYSRYYVKDQKLGHLAEAAVSVSSPALRRLKTNRKPATHKIDQTNFRFVPETTVIRTGDFVHFHNSDRGVHNVRASNTIEPFSSNIGNGGVLKRQFNDRLGVLKPVQIGCVFHSAMQAWIFVFPHPYYALTKEDGKFRLSGIPEGSYTLQMAHPGGGLRWSKRVKVTAGKTLKLDIGVSPDNLESTKK